MDCGRVMVVLVATMPAIWRGRASSRISSSASNDRSGATLTRTGLVECGVRSAECGVSEEGEGAGEVASPIAVRWTDWMADRISSRADLSCNCLRFGVLGEL